MMKRQLNDAEKDEILEKFGRICYATGHKIPDGEEIHFDHIKAYSTGGPTELNNIAPMCKEHNLSKGALPLEDFRTKLKIAEFFKVGNRLTLKDLLKYLKQKDEIKTFGEKVVLSFFDHSVKLENYSFSQAFEVQECPLTKWKYFYCSLPVDVLDSDDDEGEKIGLQPRFLIFDKVFEMFRHFQHYPVLQPSIGRINDGRILLFDGQHKAAALLWTGRRIFECKIYINPEIDKLNQANISAHDKFAQTRFYSSIMVLKLGAQFGKDFDEYKNIEQDIAKSEVGFLEYLGKKDLAVTRGEINEKFRSYLYKSILENDDNKWRPFVSISNRSSKEQPITLDMLSKSVFTNFLCTEPLTDNILTDSYKRDVESVNVIKLMNIMYEQSLCSWNINVGANDSIQNKLKRIYGSKSIMAWTELLKDAVCAKLDILDSDEKAKIFYREISDSDFSKIGNILSRLYNWQMWSSPKETEIDTIIAGNKKTIKEWFRSKGLTVGYLLGASE
ncbi:MAG: HNH endonuclease [Bacteroidales bacterium]|nr:HNH endonuclease [Bacteroidales bacterium]